MLPDWITADSACRSRSRTRRPMRDSQSVGLAISITNSDSRKLRLLLITATGLLQSSDGCDRAAGAASVAQGGRHHVFAQNTPDLGCSFSPGEIWRGCRRSAISVAAGHDGG